MRRRPYSVVLFDEIEKAHPDVFNTLLQVLDDGRLTDGQGRTVNFTNTIIIMTSNLGSTVIHDWDGKDFGTLETKLHQVLGKHFRPEFLNRIDDIVIFDRISKENMQRIAEVQLAKVTKQLKLNKDITLDISQQVKDTLAEQGYDPAFGARPLKRLIQTKVLDPLALELINGTIKDGQRIEALLRKDKVVFTAPQQ